MKAGLLRAALWDALALIWLAFLLLGVNVASADVGKPLYHLDADSSFDPFSGDIGWLTEHVALIKGYGAAGRTKYCAVGLPAIDYHDAATEGYAPLTPTKRSEYMAKVEVDKAAGCLGVFNDDINLGTGYRDGAQSSSYEPEARELAALVEQERAYWPGAIIETNTQWHDIRSRLAESDPSIKRIIAASSLIAKEFGVGPTAGINSTSDYEALLDFNEEVHVVDWQRHGLEREGKGMVFGGDPGSKTVDTMEYNLATYLLVNQEPRPRLGLTPSLADYINTPGEYKLPPTWWAGMNVDLGRPWSTRWQPILNGQKTTLWARRFTNGLVVVDPPGHASINLGFGCNSTEWAGVNPIALHEKQGVVCTW